MAGQVGTQVLRLASTLVLARILLSPEAFGLVALVNVFISGLEMLSDVGIRPSVVQHTRGDQASFMRTALTVQLVRGGVLWIVAAILAWPFSWLYQEPALAALVTVAGLATLIRGAASIDVHLLSRRVAVRSLTMLMLVSELAGFVVAVTWAILAPSIWALIAGTVASAMAYTIASHAISHDRLRPGWEWASATDILRFGGWVFVGTATWFLCSQGERLFLGSLCSPAELGLYALALGLATAPTRIVKQVSAQVVFPLLAETLRTNDSEAIKDYRRARIVFVVAGAIVALILIPAGPALVKILFGDTYAGAGPIVMLLGVRSSFFVCSAAASTFALARGASVYSAIQNSIGLCLMVAGIWLGNAVFGLLGAVAGLTLAPVLAHIVSVVAVTRLLPKAVVGELLIMAAYSAVVVGVTSLVLMGSGNGATSGA